MASPPRRVRLRRTRGWRKPPGVIVVARPSRWGNPHVVGADGRTRADAVAAYREDLLAGRLRVTVQDAQRELRGRDLACWCPPDEPCHAEVLLEIANG